MGNNDFQSLISSMSPQLSLLEKLGMFKEAELKAIKDHRKYHKMNLSDDNPSCEDILTYARFELDLLAIMREKEVDITLENKKNSITRSSANCLNKLLNIMTGVFPQALQMWLFYVKFCQEMKDTITLKQVLVNLLKVHKENPMVFQLASRCAREDFENVDKARNFLVAGLEFHPESPDLYREAFQLELSISRQKYEELSKNDAKLTKPAEEALIVNVTRVYEATLMKIHSVDLIVEFYRAIKGIQYLQTLEEKICKDLETNFKLDEAAWDSLASIKLEQLKNPKNEEIQENQSAQEMKKILEEAVAIYKKAIERLNTPKMWQLYLDRLWELHKDSSVPCPHFKKTLLKKAFIDAQTAKQMTEKYYFIWAEFYADKEDGLACQMSILNAGSRLLPTSVPIWTKKIMVQLTQGAEIEAWTIFREAVSHFKGDKAKMSLSLWKFMLRYYQVVDPGKVQMLFEEGVLGTSEVAAEMKPMYLEWMILSQGMGKGRQLYNQIALSEPYSMGLHHKMMEMENMQVKRNVERLKQCHALSTKQFGHNDVNSWMDYIRFEYSIGRDKEAVSTIVDEARKRLQPALVDEFNSEIRLFAIEHLASSSAKIRNAINRSDQEH